MASNVQVGTAVAKEEVDGLTELRGLFKPSESLKNLDAYSTWLFAMTALVGSLGTGLGFLKFRDLHGNGRRIYEIAVLFLGISLGLSAIARIPQLARANVYNTASMRQHINRILVARAAVLTAAGLTFALALGLAAYAPWQSDQGATGNTTGFSYTLGETGQLHTQITVRGAKPDSAVIAELRLYPASAQRVHIRARALASPDGTATLTLVLSNTAAVRRVVLYGRWNDSQGRTLVGRVTIPVRDRSTRSARASG